MGKDEKLSLDKLIQESLLYDSPLTEKQKDILNAAEKLFSDQGYSDTPTAEIAKKAGVTEKTLFKHFPTKADLLRRVMFPLILRIVVPSQLDHMKNLIQKANDMDELFRSIFRDRLALVSRHGHKLKFVVGELLKNDDLRLQVIDLWKGGLWSEVVQMIDRMKKAGKIRTDISSEIVARSMLSMIASYVFASQIIPNKWDHEKDVDQIAKIFIKGISP